VNELKDQYLLIDKVLAEVLAKYSMKEIPHMVGTMIEIPRACLTADKICRNSSLLLFWNQ